MPLSSIEVELLSKRLLEAEKKCTAIDPLTNEFDLDYDDAYSIQIRTIELKVEEGAKIVGKKIGLTSKAMQELIGIDEPDFGIIVDKQVYPEGEDIPVDRMIVPRIEAEIGFYLKKDLKGPGITVLDVLDATEGIFPLLEVKDSRINNLKPTLQDAIADNATSGVVILGGKMIPITSKIDLRLIGMIFEANGKIIDTATGAAALGNPAEPVAWLANKLSKYNIVLKKGEFIMSGGLTKAIAVNSGDCFKATFDHIGSVTAVFK